MVQPVPEAVIVPDDNRVVPRRRVMKSGKITFGDFKFARDCAVRDVSEAGARISTAGAHEIPSEFFLVLSSDRTMRRVEVKWRRGNELGVTFVGDPVQLVGNSDSRLRQFLF